jgi:23S rRNA pseudouridine1911/1915/1917 synthase
MSASKFIELVITEDQANKRADVGLVELGVLDSRSQIRKLFTDKKVFVNGLYIKPSQILKIGDNVKVELPPPPEDPLSPYDFPLDIVFEDEHVLVVDKPSGLVVHPSPGHYKDTLINAVIHHRIQLSPGSENFRPGLVHRIDKDTSGLLVLAKDEKTHNSLARQFKNKTVHRKYIAIVFGALKEKTGSVETFISRNPDDRKKFMATEGPEGKWAKTHYKVLEESNHLSLVELVLETGRTHQIRVHMNHIGHPVVGDDFYNGRKRANNFSNIALRNHIKEMPRFALHARELGFTHPVINKRLEFVSGWPQNLDELFNLANFTIDLKQSKGMGND